jgi:hypothetical protein
MENEKAIDEIEQFIKPLLGEVVGRVGSGFGSFITMEFGKTLTISPKSTRGEWYLWVLYAGWYVYTPNASSVGCEDTKEAIKNGIQEIYGRSLVNIKISPQTSETIFIFDMGIELHTFPISFTDDGELWKLYTPDNMVLSIFPGGKWVYRSADEIP